MIVAKQIIKDYLEAQSEIETFCKDIGLSRQTIYNITEGKNVSSEVVAKLITATGFDFEKAFEVKGD